MAYVRGLERAGVCHTPLRHAGRRGPLDNSRALGAPALPADTLGAKQSGAQGLPRYARRGLVEGAGEIGRGQWAAQVVALRQVAA